MCRFYDPLIGVLDRKTYTSWYLPSFDLKASFPDDLGTPSVRPNTHQSNIDEQGDLRHARPNEDVSGTLLCACTATWDI
jgi:hypothetical protein